MEQPTEEQKKHMRELAKEVLDTLMNIPKISKLPMEERQKIKDRLASIQKEIKEFQARYPNV